MTTTENRDPRGTGSLRQRRPGVFELRIAVGVDPVTHKTRQRSVTVHGTRHDAEQRLSDLRLQGHCLSAALVHATPGPLLTLAELLAAWIEADHPWKPSTLAGYRSVARFLRADDLGARRAQQLLPADIRGAVHRWRDHGASVSVVAGRFRVLRAAMSWAFGERLIERHPLHTMRGPSRAVPRRPLTDDQVRALLASAESSLLEAVANDTGRRAAVDHRHRCELDLLLVRLAADTGARRGELTPLRLGDLRGRVLHIERADSAGELTTPKSGHGRTLTLGRSTAALWHSLTQGWAARSHEPLGPWLFSRDLQHHQRLTATTLGRRFARVRDTAGEPEATLHRLRHSVATFLVARGQVLQAQARLGHADAATTLREYAYALPLTDEPVADAIDRHLHQGAKNADAGRRS
jgi:integrase